MASASHQQPTSFKTNVNRAKTKRWVEAKSYTYDGDDWGEADEYDEYGGYDEAPAPSKPTGLRQQGQSAGSATNSPYGSPIAPQQRGNENIRPGQPQLQYGQRSTTNPQPRITTDLGRSNSFDRGDEKRAFSAGGSNYGMPSSGAAMYQQSRQEQPPIIPNVQSPTQFDPYQMRQVQPDQPQLQQQRPTPQRDQSSSHSTHFHSPPASYQGPQPYGDPRQLSMRDRAQSTTSNTSSPDVYNRRDFTPSALPPPLHPQGHPAQDSGSISQRPPRSSSLSQTTQPPIPSTVKNTMPSMPSEAGIPHRERADSSAEKPLPFVRPAEIYKRMQEEKLREQQSQDPSLPGQIAATTGQNNYGSSIQDAQHQEQPGDSDVGGKTTSSHVPDSTQDNTIPVQSIYTSHNKPNDTLNQSSTDKWSAESPQTVTGVNPGTSRDPEAPPKTSQPSLLPVLPEVARMSTFGESFLSSSTEDHEHQTESLYSLGNSDQPQKEPATTTDASATNLQHQPSSGFRSVVNQAFDVTEDQIPPTPSSTAGSGIGRSTSGGTSVISPIISRGPSTSKQNWDSKDVAEEVESSVPQPESSESTNTTKEATNVPTRSEATGSDRKEQKRASFIPGHRRDLSTPSPNNSPARTPALESNLQLRQPQEAELATATPTVPDFGSRTSPTRGPAGRVGGDSSSGADTRNRNDVYNQSKVRDLAGKFESASSSRRGSDQSPTRRPFQIATTSQKSEIEAPSRPLGDRMESFRPRLPGAWESYVSNAPLTTSNRSLDKNSSGFGDHPGKDKGVFDEGDAGINANGPESPETPTQAKQIAKKEESSHKDPFSSVAAAGSALASALAAAAGFDNDTSKGATGTGDSARAIPHESVEATRSRSTSVNTALHPEAARPSIPNARDDDDTSSVAPTPSHLYSRPVDDAGGRVGYFPLANAFPQNERAESRELSTPLSRPPRPPILSTDTGSQYESDRLRREILRDLTPNAPSEPTTAESDSPDINQRRISSNQSLQRHDTGHESMVIPREYDRYWDDASSTSSSQGSRRKTEGSAATNRPEEPFSAGTNEGLSASPKLNTHNDLPEAVSQSDTTGTRPGLESHRFSWERSSLGPQPTADAQQKPLPGSPSNSSPYPREGPERDAVDTQAFRRQRDQSESPTVGDRSGKEISDTHDGERNAFQAPATGHNAYLATENDNTEESGGLMEKGNVLESPNPKNDGEHMIVETSHAAAVQEAYHSHPAAKSNALPGTSTVDNSVPPPSLHTSAQPKIPAFREILALKTPAERIRGYNEAREQYAALESGLNHWVTVTSSELPEHADVLAGVNCPPVAIMGHKPSSSRLLSGLRSTGTQQHLTPNPRPGNTTSEGSSPSGSGSKLQVQAKGKDLLHSAGVFGGKANVAAKGLFSKGRSRFKEARGTDKDPTPPSSPVAIPSGMQPQTQPPVDSSTEVTSDSPSFTPRSEQSICLRNSSDGHYVPDQESVPVSHPGENDRSPRSREGDAELILPFQNEQQYIRSSTADVPQPSTANGDESVSLHRPSSEDRLLLSKTISRDGSPTQAPDVESNRNGTGTPTQSGSADYNLPPRSDSLRDTVTGPAPDQHSQPKILPGPYIRSVALDVSEKSTADKTRLEEPPPSQIRIKRLSADSNGTFHTAENGFPSRPDSASAQENLETPKAEKPLLFDSEKAREYAEESRTPTTILPHTAREIESPIRDGTNERTENTRTEHVLPDPKQDYEPSLSRQEFLAREPSLDNIISQVESDRSPSPVSPQHSIHNEPIRRQSTREPIYYGPQHDFGPKTQRFPPRRPISFSQTREQPGLQDHPAFRSTEGVNHQEQSISMASESYTTNTAGQRPDFVPEENRTPRNPVADSKPKSNRNSRNSGFFMNIGSSGKVGVPSVASPADTHSPPLSTTTPNENDKRSKRASLFRSHPGDKNSEGSPSVGSSPAMSSAVRDSQSSPSAPKPSQTDQSPKNTSSMFRSRLQRASTSGNQVTEGGPKKRRFSGLASLFGSRSNRTQPNQAIQPRQSQQTPTPEFAPPQHIQHQTQRSEQRSPMQQYNHQSMVGQSHERVGTTSFDPSRYESPVHSTTSTSQTSNPVWSQAAQRVSQARQSSIKEPSAYAQDAELRQRATSPSNSANVATEQTLTAIPPNVPTAAPTVKSRNSIFSRNKSRDSSILGRSRDSSAKSWMKGREQGQTDLRNDSLNRQSQLPSTRPPMQHNTSNSTHGSQRVLTFSQFGENQVVTAPPQNQQQVPQGRSADMQSQHGSNPLPQRTSSLANAMPSQGPARVLTFNQFGDHQTTQRSTQTLPAAPAAPPLQAPASQGQHPHVVTFQQFPSNSNPQPTSPADLPPPPPPKDDWHVNKPRQSLSQNKAESREEYRNSPSHTPNPLNSISNSQRPSQEPPPAQPEPQSQYRQAPPPIQTEIPSSRLSAFSPSSNSAESRKARQRELESAVPSISTEKETVAAPPKHDASSEENIVMSSSSYPGQEWQPSFAYDD